MRPKASATLYDVAKHKVSMQQFVAGLDVTQLANIVEGAGLGGSTLSAVGAAGYSTGLYENARHPADDDVRRPGRAADHPADQLHAADLPVRDRVADRHHAGPDLGP